MDVDIKVNTETQTDQSVVSSRGVACSLLVPDSVRLLFCVPPISHGYCSICHEEGATVDIADCVRSQALLKSFDEEVLSVESAPQNNNYHQLQ